MQPQNQAVGGVQTTNLAQLLPFLQTFLGSYAI